MFVCQKCGWREYPNWRSHRWTLYAVYCRIDELEVFQPEIAKVLKEKIEYVDEHGYLYHYAVKSGIVIRIQNDLKVFWKRGHTEEKFKKRDLNQRQLLKSMEAK